MKMGRKPTVASSPIYLDLKTNQEYTSRATANCVRFDSTHEFKVFLTLRDYFPLEAIYLHFPVLIKPETTRYPAAYWNVDFAIVSNKRLESTPLMLAEAKGEPDGEFQLKLHLLQYFQPALYDRLKLVGVRKGQAADRYTRMLSLGEFKGELIKYSYTPEYRENGFSSK